MFVEYIVKSDEPFHDVEGVITFGIIEVEDELDKGEEPWSGRHMTTLFENGEIRLYLYDVTANWQPGGIYEQMLHDKLREEGCVLELVTPASIPTS